MSGSGSNVWEIVVGRPSARKTPYGPRLARCSTSSLCNRLLLSLGSGDSLETGPQSLAPVEETRRLGALAAKGRVSRPRGRAAERLARDPADAAGQPRLLEDGLGELCPRTVPPCRQVPATRRQLDELSHRRGKMADVGRAAALVVHD